MDSRQLDIALIDTLRANLPDYLFNGNPSMSTSIMNDPLLIICIISVMYVLIFGWFRSTERPSNPLFAFVITSASISLLVYFLLEYRNIKNVPTEGAKKSASNTCGMSMKRWPATAKPPASVAERPPTIWPA